VLGLGLGFIMSMATLYPFTAMSVFLGTYCGIAYHCFSTVLWGIRK